MIVSMFVRQQASPTVKTQNRDDLVALKGLVEAGAVTPVIDGTYPLSATPQAIAHVAEGHARGTVVITVSPPPLALVASADSPTPASAAA
jgi:NADPH:quinone reductase-like Zn-dependent oxidoreductase